MKRYDFNSFEEFSESGTAGEYEVLTVVTENGWIKSDLLTECKSWKTALRRFFKLLDPDNSNPAFDGWYECMRESAEGGLFKMNDSMMANGTRNPFPCYAYEIEAIDENIWYIFLNVHPGEYPTEPEESDNTTEAEAKEEDTMNATTNTSPAYIISENPQFGSLEITFSEKPAETVRAALDGEIAPATAGKVTETKAAKVDKEALRAEFAKAWSSQKMIDFCVNKVAAVAVLPSGEIVTVDKKSIETRFCFGESGYDYEEAQAAARHAAQSQGYFRSENMSHFDKWISDLEEARNMTGNYLLTINAGCYNGQTADCKLRSINFQRISKVLDDLGGSAFLADLPGHTITERGSGRNYRIATREEVDAILTAYKEARAAHEKKVNAYLKRYGMSKVDTWTYWIDA